MELKHIPITELHVATVNMRHARKAPDISDILPSVKARGILQPLLVRPNADGYEIVAGRRRYFCAKTIAAEAGSTADIPCAIMEPGDDAGALEASLIENVARADADAMTEFETYSRLIREGRNVSEIAATFGATEQEVKQRLALGNLHPKIREAYRADAIDDQSLRYLTLATKAQQKEWLALFESEDANIPWGYQLKQWLFAGASISTKVALFDLAQYTGHVAADLFGDDSYFSDTEQFWQLQNAAIEAKANTYREAGWSDVVMLEPGTVFAQWDHEKTPKKKGGKVFVAISQRGDVNFHEGWLSHKEARKAEKAEGKDAKATTAKSPQMTQVMENYIDLHRHAIVRHALLGNAGVALRLLIAHALAPTGNWQVKSDPQRARTPEIAVSLAASPAQGAFETERKAVRKLLHLPVMDNETRFERLDTAKLFQWLLSLSDDEVMRVAAFAIADTLSTGDVVDAVGNHLKPDVSSLWQPDGTFFDLLRDRATANAMVAEIAGKPVAKANRDEKVKAQKQIVRDCLNGANGRAKPEHWLPGWMQFPFKSYGKISAKTH